MMNRLIIKFFISCLAFIIPFTAIAQEPANIYKWNFSSKKTGEGKYDLVFTTSSAAGWQLYAPNQMLGDVKTVEISFPDSSITVENISDAGESKSFTSTIFENTTVKVYEAQTEWKVSISINGVVPAQLQGKLTYFYGNTEEFNPEFTNFNVSLEGGVDNREEIKVASIDINKSVADCGDDATTNKSILSIFLLGFLGGLIALLTPCVFPMIPVTVSFFTKKSQDRKKAITNAVFYGLFIFLIYVLITVPFHVANKTISPEIFNNISTNVWLNLVFFLIFVVFAVSFFGYFEIGLPAGLANKMDSKSGLGNIGGIFFMAGTLAIVSFSCTGPILGTLLVGVAEQGAWPLTAGAAGFGIALGLPFALFAMFPNWLHSLPKSGGWMTDVKVVLGFVELALAVKFFSNADLVEQWGILKREIFIGLWVIISLLTVLYLLGKIKFPHSGSVTKFSFPRIAFIILFSTITIYLLPGLTNTKYADLKLISGFPPPRTTYSLYNSDKKHNEIFEPMQNDYAGALKLAKEQGKPVLIDFTGWACVNCRRMEEKVWPNKVVDSLMRNEFIVVSLYVDERRKLPLTKQTVYKTSSGQEKSIITVGDKWSTFQTENFGATSQPWLKCGLETHRKQINK
jgi:thiol:disulfide interchange protein